MRNSDKLRKLLKGIETGDPDAASVVNEAKYIQHNPQTHEGSEGLAVLFARLAKTNPRVNIVRAFDDGDFAFGHTEYDFATRRIGFEVFRFEDGLAVEHWDNIQARQGPNPSGRSMVDGPTEAIDLEKTEENRALVRSFMERVMIGRNLDQLDTFVAQDLIQHTPTMADGVAVLRAALKATQDGTPLVQLTRLHRVLAQGNFVLSVSEGTRVGALSAFYSLWRIADGRIVEHWNTVEKVPPESEWKNDNGKF